MQNVMEIDENLSALRCKFDYNFTRPRLLYFKDSTWFEKSTNKVEGKDQVLVESIASAI